MKAEAKEWTISAPWGKIAIISWGDPKNYPVFLVHGRQDSSSSFFPLLELLPDHYYYVAMDLPGHGRSDKFPIGLKLTRTVFLYAVDLVLIHLKWKEFIYLAHSLGTDLGLWYNAIYPNKVKKFIFLDPGPPFTETQITDPKLYLEYYYEDYYKHYDDHNVDKRVYTKEKAMESIKRARNLTDDKAKIILDRNLFEVGPNLYRLSWDIRLKRPVHWPLPNYTYFELFSANAPPTIMFTSIDAMKITHPPFQKAVNELFKKFGEHNKNFSHYHIEGDHNLHFIHPERVIDRILQFLETNFDTVTSKL